MSMKFSKNFSETTLLRGETTSFYRIQKETSEQFKYWIIPEVMSGDCGQVLINGIKYSEYIEDLEVLDNIGSPTTEYFYNIFGPSQSQDLWNQYGGNNTTPGSRTITGSVGIKRLNWITDDRSSDFGTGNKEITIRIDYYGAEECIIRINVLIARNYVGDLFTQLPKLSWTPTDGELVGYSESDSPDNTPVWLYNTSSPVGGIEIRPEKFFPTLKELHQNDILLGNLNDPEVYVIKSNIICKPIESTGVNRDVDYILDKEIMDGKKDGQSFMLLQTNPKLTGNIKLIVDSESKLYLETMDATPELSQDRYKKRPVNQFTDFPSDLKRYFGGINSEILFSVYNKNSDYNTTKFSLFEQYDNFYSNGTSQLDSKYYDEELSIFAPLWLKRNIPEFFVVFKTPGPLNIDTYEDGVSQKDIIKEVLKESQIIKTYDMRNGTDIGNYLRKITNDERYRENPLRVVFEQNELSTWNGISYTEGIMTEKGEYLHDFFREDNPINKFEDTITKGFERNKLISNNLINLEFLFTDDTSELYQINRYFGLYVDFLDIEEFNIDVDKLINISGQTPAPVIGKNLTEFSTTPFFQSNEDGINLPIFNVDRGLSSLLLKEERIFSVIDRDNGIWKIKDLNDENIVLHNTNIDMSKFTGNSNISAQVWAEPISPSFSQIEINIVEVENKIIEEGETFTIEEDIAYGIKWICVANSNLLNKGESWVFPVYNEDTNTWINNFSVKGDVNDITTALNKCINSFSEKSFISYVKNNNLYIKNTTTTPLNFRRGFVVGSNYNTLGIFNNFPLRTFNTYEQIGIITNEQISIETENTPNLSIYKVELSTIVGGGSPINLQIGEFKIYRNGGLLNTFYKELDNNFQYSWNNITVNYTYNGTPISGTIWEFQPVDTNVNFKFIGNSDVTGNRVVILREDLDKVNAISWFQWQKNNYSKLEQWEVFGNIVYNINYLEEPLFDKDGQIVSYKDLEKYVIIQLPNNYKFTISNENRITSFVSYFPKIGLLSIADVKIFDTDWLDSDYSKTPTAELFSLYEKLEVGTNQTIEINNNQSYQVIKGEGELWGQRLDNDEWEIIELIFTNDYFNTFSMNYIFQDDEWNVGEWESGKTMSPNFYHKVYKKFRVSNNEHEVLEIIKNIYYENPDARQFNGFLGISDFTSIEDEISFSNLLKEYDVDRFLLGQLKSEYDRLRENFNKDFITTSKVVPTILKWVMDSKDCRDNPYRLNNSLAFGINNFSPDADIAESNPQLLTREFLYIDSLPKDFDKDFLNSSVGIFFDNISDKKFFIENDWRSWYDLFKLTTSIDYFSKYFTIGTPTERDGEEVVQLTNQRRYETTKFVSGVDEVQCIFKGVKLSFNEYDNDGNLIKGSRKWEGYKFSTILRFLPIPIEGIVESFNKEFIINERHKTILFAVTIYVNDYLLKGGEWGYSNLYFTESSMRLRSTIDEPGNWRFIPEYTDTKLNNWLTEIEEGTPEITVTLGKEIQDIKLINYKQNNLVEYFGITEEDYEWVKTLSPHDSKYSSLHHYYKFTDSKYIENVSMDSAEIIDKTEFTVPRSNFTRTFRAIKTYNSVITPEGTRISLISGNLYLEQIINPELWYMDGGELYLENIINNLSFANLKLLMNDKSQKINVSFKQPNKIHKKSRLMPVNDEDKPDTFTNINIIGFNLENTNENEVIYRYNGLYTPKTKEVLKFNMREYPDLIELFGMDMLNTNTTLNLDIENNSILKNKWFNKVGDNNLSKIGQGSKYQSLYPLIDEINIDHKDYNIWSSNWDADYYTFYTSMKDKNTISGLNEIKNFKSFMGSKNMKIPQSFSINEFIEDEYQFSIESSKSNDITSRTGTSQTVSIRLFIDNIIRRYLIEMGAEHEFHRLNKLGIIEKVFGREFSDDEITNLTIQYINTNLLKLYTVNQIFLWRKRSDNVEFIDNLTREEKIISGFKTINTKILKEVENNYIMTNIINIDNIQSFSAEVFIERI